MNRRTWKQLQLNFWNHVLTKPNHKQILFVIELVILKPSQLGSD